MRADVLLTAVCMCHAGKSLLTGRSSQLVTNLSSAPSRLPPARSSGSKERASSASSLAASMDLAPQPSCLPPAAPCEVAASMPAAALRWPGLDTAHEAPTSAAASSVRPLGLQQPDGTVKVQDLGTDQAAHKDLGEDWSLLEDDEVNWAPLELDPWVADGLATVLDPAACRRSDSGDAHLLCMPIQLPRCQNVCRVFLGQFRGRLREARLQRHHGDQSGHVGSRMAVLDITDTAART